MSVIVTDAGFGPDDWTEAGKDFVAADTLGETDGDDLAVDLLNDADPEALAPHFERLTLIRLRFPSFADGRGFSQARRLRSLGWRGRLRAAGHVLADQYGHARKVGFDEVEIDDALAERQPEAQWLGRVEGLRYVERFRRNAA